MKRNPVTARDECPGEFARSSLWRNGFKRGAAGRDKKTAAFFRQELLNLRGKAAILVAQIPKDIPGLTVHDITHLDALWETASLALGDSYALNPAEAYVLGAAILLHDAGMSLASYPSGIEDIKSTDEWRDTVTACLHENGIEDVSDKQLAIPSERITKLAVARVLRALHARHAAELPLIQWHGPDRSSSEFLIDNADLRNFYGSLIGRIAKSHHVAVTELPGYLGSVVGAMACAPTDWTVDPVKIACILRVADATHIDERRAPRFLYLLSKLEGQSVIHWNFQSKLGKARVEKDALLFSSGPDFALRDADAWWLCYDTAQSVDRELRQVDLLLEKLRKPRFAARRVLGTESPSSFSNCVRTTGWVPVDTHLRVSDVPGIVKLLGGSHLYGDNPRIAIRELIQNASDAVRARRLIQSRSPKDGRVTIRVTRLGSEWWLEVEDNGVGMSESTLTGALLDFGKPFWSGEAVMEEFPGLLAKGMSATGRFGIGFFSVFMLGDLVRVVSRRFDASTQSARTLEFRSGLELQPILRRAERRELIPDGGTRVSVRLKLDPFGEGGILARKSWDDKVKKVDLKSLVGSLCPSIDVNVSVQVNGRERVCVVGDDWRRLDGVKLLRRIGGPDIGDGVPIKGEQTYAAHIRPLVDEKGKLHGRACIVGMERYFTRFDDGGLFDGVCTVGGLKAADLSNIAGVLCAYTENVSRDQAIPTVPAETLRRWATEQSKLISRSNLPPSDKLRAAAIVLKCGGSIGRLPIAVRGGEYLSYYGIKRMLSGEEEIIVFEDECVRYDSDEDGCHPKQFENSFEPEERLFFVWDVKPSILTIGKREWPRDLLQPTDPTSPSSLGAFFKKALLEQWGPDYDEFHDERTVGEVDGDKILREVTVYRKS